VSDIEETYPAAWLRSRLRFGFSAHPGVVATLLKSPLRLCGSPFGFEHLSILDQIRRQSL
jgi:hypothetical protein